MQDLQLKHVATSELFGRYENQEKSIASTHALPSPAQVQIAVELVWGWGGKYTGDYPKRCEAERRRGAVMPRRGSSMQCCQRILIAASEVEYERDRDIHIPEALETSWAQDAAHNNFLMKYQVVGKDFRVRNRMVDIVEPSGDRAFPCVKDMERGLNFLCSAPVRCSTQGKEADSQPSQASNSGHTGAATQPCSGVKRKSDVLGTSSASSTSPDAVAEPIVATATKSTKPGHHFFIERVLCPTTKKKFQSTCRNATADGTPVEQLALRLAKNYVLPNLDFITRAEERCCHLVLNNAAKDCKWLVNLLLGMDS